ncbi:DNA-binding protein [Ventosimonas gracilis]|uniref:DNA-binding protein n=1 Tax=Ventosimonas gracilis TaxID=1680762 RepID=A0A139SUP2_9GAMM|nr:putative toxin-antitoxin system toxin component, PIN family [Ventosimonas gracilis]KXU38316.1 DNA-binding protein [Ventosimonas gracilis]
MARLRVVLDTNVLVSGLAYPGSVPGRIMTVWQQGGLGVVLSHYILDELVQVLPRLKKVHMTAMEIRDLADSLMFQAEMVEPDGVPDLALRDPADQAILQTLLTSGARYLVTGDKDLLALADRYPIVTPADFWAQYGM